MNLQQLEYIIALAEKGNFSRAADQCHVSQATLSAMVKKLETELELTIFDRSAKPVLVTKEGEAVIETARRIISERDALYALKNTEAEPDGLLRLGIIPTIAGNLLPIVLQPLLQQFPKLELELREITTEEIIRQLDSGDIDGGILATPIEGVELEEITLYYEPMWVYGKSVSDKKYVAPQTLEQQDVWLLDEGHCFRDQSMTICKLKDEPGMRHRFHFGGSSFGALLQLTEQFGGLTLLPELFYRELPAAQKKLAAEFRKPVPVREISLVYKRPWAHKRSLEAIASFISNSVKGKLSSSKRKAAEMQVIGI